MELAFVMAQFSHATGLDRLEMALWRDTRESRRRSKEGLEVARRLRAEPFSTFDLAIKPARFGSVIGSG